MNRSGWERSTQKWVRHANLHGALTINTNGFYLLLIEKEPLEVMEQNCWGIWFICVTVQRQQQTHSQTTPTTYCIDCLCNLGLSHIRVNRKLLKQNKETATYPRIKAQDSFLNSSRIWEEKKKNPIWLKTKYSCIRNIQLNSLKCHCTQLINHSVHCMTLVHPNLSVLKKKKNHYNSFSHLLEFESVKLTPTFLCRLYHTEQDKAVAFPSTTCNKLTMESYLIKFQLKNQNYVFVVNSRLTSFCSNIIWLYNLWNCSKSKRSFFAPTSWKAEHKHTDWDNKHVYL